MSMLEIKNLSVNFINQKNDKFQAVKDINLKLDEGEILGIVGESGSGKSVSALSILGLLPYPKATHGSKSSIVFNNQELIDMNNKDFQKIRGGDIAFIFQEPMSSLNPLHKIGKQIEETLILHQSHLNKKDLKRRVLDLLKAVKISEPESKINAYPFELSGGQRQRVMIAMAIANNPKILIADEPTTALDVTIQEQIIDLLLELKQKLGMAIIFISHNLRLVHKIADNIAVMYQGKLVEYGSSEQIFNNPQHSYTKKLISSNLSLNLENNVNNNDVILKAENITVTFPLQKNLFGKITNELKAVNDVSFELNRGETLGIVGESGSGKTTLAMSIVNLVKHSGKILIKNNNITEEVKHFSKNLQVVFQDPYNSLNPRMNIAQI
ncbi:MAG: ABC transporter ATP-binding protein, partial [Alphaproteobacteria bacterium]|nr:ABC transporter ATP-binding protein [Alphaproteobacteria bacterium]